MNLVGVRLHEQYRTKNKKNLWLPCHSVKNGILRKLLKHVYFLCKSNNFSKIKLYNIQSMLKRAEPDISKYMVFLNPRLKGYIMLLTDSCQA